MSEQVSQNQFKGTLRKMEEILKGKSGTIKVEIKPNSPETGKVPASQRQGQPGTNRVSLKNPRKESEA